MSDIGTKCPLSPIILVTHGHQCKSESRGSSPRSRQKYLPDPTWSGSELYNCPFVVPRLIGDILSRIVGSHHASPCFSPTRPGSTRNSLLGQEIPLATFFVVSPPPIGQCKLGPPDVHTPYRAANRPHCTDNPWVGAFQENVAPPPSTFPGRRPR